MGDKFSIWEQHFIKQAKGLVPHQDNFYKVTSEKQRDTDMTKGDTGSKVNPHVGQIVERAKNAPTTIYDPVSGVARQTVRSRHRVKTSKRKGPTKRRRQSIPRKKKRKGKGRGKKKITKKITKKKKKVNRKK